MLLLILSSPLLRFGLLLVLAAFSGLLVFLLLAPVVVPAAGALPAAAAAPVAAGIVVAAAAPVAAAARGILNADQLKTRS